MYEIKVKIHEEADLYSSLDPDREQLDMEVVSSAIRLWMRNGSERISGLFWNGKRKMRNSCCTSAP